MFRKLKEKILSFGDAAITHLIEDGWQDLPDNHYFARLGICSTCEFKKPNEWVCGECGCDLLLKAKWPAMECPKGKWLRLALPLVSENQIQQNDNKEIKKETNCGCGS